MKWLFHKVAHLFGWNYGICDSYYENGKLMMSFLCTGCGKRSGIHCVDYLIDERLKEANND